MEALELDIAWFFGYFLVMLIFMLVAILTAKWLISWLFYGIGAVIQFRSLYGNQSPKSIWTVYFIIAIISAVLIIYRRIKCVDSDVVWDDQKKKD